MILTMAVNFIFNLVMLVPLIYTGSKINERHALLEGTIGILKTEDHSYKRVHLLLNISLPFFIIASVLEPAVYMFYNTKFHPWKDILIEDEIVDFNPPSLAE